MKVGDGNRREIWGTDAMRMQKTSKNVDGDEEKWDMGHNGDGTDVTIQSLFLKLKDRRK